MSLTMFRRLTLWVALLAGAAQAVPSSVPLPTPLTYVTQLEPLEGHTLLLREASCQADGKPLTQGRVYFRKSGSQLTVARVEYNEQGKYVLEHGNNGKAYTYFQEYVQQQKPLSLYTLNTLIGLWRFFGYRFSLDNVSYHCQLT